MALKAGKEDGRTEVSFSESELERVGLRGAVNLLDLGTLRILRECLAWDYTNIGILNVYIHTCSHL